MKNTLTQLMVGCVLLCGLLTLPALADPPPQVSSITPNSSSNNIAAVATVIGGSNFVSGASALLTQAGQSNIVGTSVTVTDSGATNLTATFNLSNVTTGSWNVVVTNPDSQSSTLANGFTVLAAPPVVTFQVSTSPSLSGGGTTAGDGTYTNGTSATATATPNSCYTFVNWTDQNSNVVSASSSYTFTVVTNTALVGNFALVGVSTNGSLTTLWTFPGGTGGANPEGSLVQGTDGNFYGTTVYGGPVGSGTVFRITPGGSLTNLHLFGGTDGANPSAGLVQGSDGNFYGTTATGGTKGYGTVFRITPNGTLTTLVSFTNGLDGSYPYGALIQASDGNFYGTTYEGGLTGGGTIFRMTPGGSLSNLWSFTGDGAGIYPFAGVIQGSDGNFYGTTTYGGAHDAGLVYRITPGGSLTNLHSFADGEGSYPYGGLVEGGDGNFYGTTYQGGANGYGSVYRITPSSSLTNLWSFTNGVDGGDSFANLIPGSDGNFYGTTFGSGTGPSSYGTVFRITPAGGLTNLWEFTGCGDGGNSYAGLVQGNDGGFYGVTFGLGSGPTANGTVFRINAGLCANRVNTSSAPPAGGLTSGGGLYSCGSNLTVCASANSCYSFANWTDQNSNVVSTSVCYTFVSATNETLTANFSLNTYAIATSSSPAGGGSVSGSGTYPCGTNLTVTATATANSCFSFVNWTDQNSNVVSTLPSYSFIVTTNLTLVANFAVVAYTINTSSSPFAGGSTSGGGTVACGSNVTVCASPNSCYNFVNWTGQNSNVVSASPCFAFLASSNQTLTANFAPISYTITTTNLFPAAGSVSGGGTVACGSNVTVCASPNSCYSFVNWTDQNSNVVTTSACFTFPAAANEVLAANFALISYGNPGNSELTNLWSFAGVTDGANPQAGLVQGSDGNFYGTSYAGGPNGFGKVYRISAGGGLTNLWSFTGSGSGANPKAPLVQGSDGNFYGTTVYGGGSGHGCVYRITPGGSLTNLHSFGLSDGANPSAGLVQGSDGNFYGTAAAGGSSGYGTVFQITPNGALTTLASFTNGLDGSYPYGALIQGGDGNFYGTTTGSGSGPSANGSVFRITSSGSLTTLWSFTGDVDGASPYAGLILGGDGNFYGTTSGSGSGPSAYGTVFRITSGGSLTTLWSFAGCGDGGNPFDGLVQGSDGNFYGTTSGSGSGPSAYGTVFQITPGGSLTTLWSFTNGADGASPYGALMQGSDGNFYGTTSGSGSGSSPNGTVFKLFIPLNPPANQISAIQVGSSNVVLILPSVAGETYQLQFSSSLTPTDWSNVDGASISNSIGGLFSLTNFGGALQPQGFYRFNITP